MAKLPDIQLRRVSLPTGAGPEVALQKAATRRGVVQALASAADAVADVKRRYDVAEASATLSSDLADFEAQYAGKQMYTPDEVRELGLADVVETGSGALDDRGNAIEREFIPAHEVYPLALQQRTEAAIADSAELISSDQVRRSWLNEAKEKQADTVANATRLAAQNAYKYEVATMGKRIETLQATDKYAAAGQMIMALPISQEEREALLVDNQQRMENYQISSAIDAADSAQIEVLISRMTSDEYEKNSMLNQEDQSANLKAAFAKQNALDVAYNKERKARQDTLAIELLDGLFAGDVGIADISANRQQLGLANYSKLANKAQIIEEKTLADSDPMLAQTFQQYLIRMEYGDFSPEETLDDINNEAAMYLLDNLGMTDPNGNIRPGLTASDVNSYRSALRSTYKSVIENPAYKQIMQEAGQRIANISGVAFSMEQPTEENANLLASFRLELQQYIRENGSDPAGMRAWAKDRLPDYLSDKGKAAMAQVPRGLLGDVRFSPSGALDTAQTLERLTKRLTRFEERAADGNETARRQAAELRADMESLQGMIDRGQIEVDDGA